MFVYFGRSEAGGKRETDQTVKWLKVALKKSNYNIIPGNRRDTEIESALVPRATLASCQQPGGHSNSASIFT